jgi:hypothetical protein
MASERIDENERIGNMTKRELKDWVNRLVEQRMIYGPGNKTDERSHQEIFLSIRKNRLKREPGQPSVLEMLREDRGH